MAVKILILSFFCLKVTNSQFYGQPPSPYQPSFYPQQQSMYPTLFAPLPSQYPLPFPLLPPELPPPTPFTPPNQCSGIPQPSYAQPFPYNPASSGVPPPNFAPYPPMPNYPQIPNYPPTYPPAYPTPQYPAYHPALQTQPSSTSPNYQTTKKIAPTKLPPNTAIYYLSRELPKAAEAVQENILENPEYKCPFCNGFADVPKSSKLAPPPSSTSVLPGILDKIPTITKPDVSKLEDLKELCKKPLAELLEHKLSGKLRFDQDVLDGFLTGLGFGKNKKTLLV